ASDHRYIRFDISEEEAEINLVRNPRNTNWKLYKEAVTNRLRREGIPSIRNSLELELAMAQINSIVMDSYKDNCKEREPRGKSSMPWWNSELSDLKKSVRKAYNKAKSSNKTEDWYNVK